MRWIRASGSSTSNSRSPFALSGPIAFRKPANRSLVTGKRSISKAGTSSGCAGRSSAGPSLRPIVNVPAGIDTISCPCAGEHMGSIASRTSSGSETVLRPVPMTHDPSRILVRNARRIQDSGRERQCAEKYPLRDLAFRYAFGQVRDDTRHEPVDEKLHAHGDE